LPRISRVLIALYIFIFSSTSAVSRDRQGIIVNGGGKPSINFSDSEYDLLVFRDHLFGGKASILNAQGEEAQVVFRGPYSGLERNSMGEALLSPSSIKEKYPPATFENYTKIISGFSEQKGKDYTFIFLDHGNDREIALWQEGLDREKLKKSFASLPAGAWVRSIHTHCSAGAMIVDPKRKLPDDITKAKDYFIKHYPPMECQLAISMHDEYSSSSSLTSSRGKVIYSGSDKDSIREATVNDGAWTGFLKKNKHTSLQMLNDFWTEDERVFSTPVLTSDYFIEDLAHIICQTLQNPKANEDLNCDPKEKALYQFFHSDVFKELRKKFYPSICIDKKYEELRTRRYQLKYMDELEKEFEKFKRVYIRDYWKKISPKSFAEYERALANLGALRAQFALLPPSEKEKRGKEFSKMAKPFEKIVNTGEKNIDSAIVTRLPEALAKNGFQMKMDFKAYPNIARFIELNGPTWATVSSLFSAKAEYFTFQKKRRKTEFEARKTRAEKMLRVLDYAGMERVKDLYETIRYCETSSLN